MSRFFQSLWPLLTDFMSTAFFVGLYAVTGNIVLSVALGTALGIAQIGLERIKGRPIDGMQWMSLALVVILGGLTLLTRDPRFAMVKPSIAKFAIGLVMLKRGWMNRYLPPIVRENITENLIDSFGYAWATLMFILGIANLAIDYFAGFAASLWFISMAPLAATVLLFGTQYAIFRTIITRRIRAGLAVAR